MLTGSCHCGALRWRIDDVPPRATACNCTVCRRFGALWAYGWLGEDVATEGDGIAYFRDERELGFHHCPTCGCVVWWQAAAPDAEGRVRIAVNLRMSDDPTTVAALPIRHFDGLDKFEALRENGCQIRDLWF
ncbi:GFA family protein [Oceanomicrobium pacificus]|uniref:GFA family protein n=1 Tax=Oceanomicrobium pacificus TaxID=2692916 RepID=A0A6B0TY70_9RHOB|nr:GFA family protein [Oceanomicrobium pacificus]MXU66232.1 GFA family protein [Oceanomicrobium pacificus]